MNIWLRRLKVNRRPIYGEFRLAAKVMRVLLDQIILNVADERVVLVSLFAGAGINLYGHRMHVELEVPLLSVAVADLT